MTASRPPSTQRRYRGGLALRLLFVIWGLSLIPVLFLGGVTFYRSLILLREQATNQLRTIVQSEINELERSVETHHSLLSGLGENKSFSSNLDVVLRGNSDLVQFHSLAASKVLFDFQSLAKTQTDDLSNEFLILDTNGKVINSTNNQLNNFDFRADKRLAGLVGAQNTFLLYNVPPFGSGEFVLFISEKYQPSDPSIPQATLVNISITRLPQRVLNNAANFYPSAQAYFYTPTDSILRIDPTMNIMLAFTPKADQSSILTPLLAFGERSGQAEFTSFGNTPVLAYGQYIPINDISLVLEIPQQIVYQPFVQAIPITVGFMVIAMLLIGGLIWLGTNSLVRPILELSKSTQNFANGNWQARSKVQRADEIGLLAESFNHMADDLTSAYNTVKSESEERTRQLRTAAEIAQLATSAQTMDELFKRTVTLLTDRFGYYHAAILLLDPSGKKLLLKEVSGEAGQILMEQRYQILVGSQSIIGWVAANRQARVVSSVVADPLYMHEPMLPDTQSEVVIPILYGDDLLGVMDVQSIATHAFNDESVIVLQTLANQTASAIKNMHLVETSEGNLAENMVLYEASRRIVAATNEADIFQQVASALNQSGLVSAVLIYDGDRFKVSFMHDPDDKSKVKFPEWVSIPLVGIEGNLPLDRPSYFPEINQAPNGLTGVLSVARRFNCVAAALFPVASGDKFTAILILASRKPDGINPSSLKPYGNLAAITGTTIERMRLLTLATDSNEEYRKLAEISREVSVETEPDKLFPVLYREIQKTTGQVDFLIALYDAQEDRLDIPFCIEGSQVVTIPSLSLGEGLITQVVKYRKPLMLVKDTLQQARAMGAKIVGKPAKSWLGVPLIAGGNLIGAMVIQDLEHEGRFTEKDMHLMRTLSTQVAITVRNVQLLAQMNATLNNYEHEKFLLDMLLGNTPDAIFFKNRQGQFTRASQSMARIVGLKDPTLMVGKSDFDFTDPDEAARIYKEEQEIMATGLPQMGVIEHHVTSEKGENWVMTSRLPIKNSEGEVVGVFGISNNITELKKMQELAQLRTQQVRTAAEIARDTSSTLDLGDLLERSVNLVRDRFGFYHVSVFLLDSLRQFAIVRESTGEAGRQLKIAGHKLAVGSKSLVGQATSTGEPIVINDVSKEPTHFRNPLLPDTQAEAAIPLKIGEHIIGALDVQSTHIDAFTPEDINILQLLADQLAIAVTNSNLFSETQDNLTKHRLLHHITTAAASSDSMAEALQSSVNGLRVAMGSDRISILRLKPEENVLEVEAFAGYAPEKVQKLKIPVGMGITGLAASEKHIIRLNNVQEDPRYIGADPGVHSEMAVPLIFRDELLGVLNLESDDTGAYTESDQEMLGTLGSSLAAIIANARLLERIRAQVDRDQHLYEITSKIRHSVDIQTILEVSATEIGRYLNTRRTQIDIQPVARKDVPVAESQSIQLNGNGSYTEVK